MIKDRSDKFNPILIKELVQGMRTKSFVGVFIITQVIMLLVTLTLVGQGQFGNNREGSTMMFWAALALPFLLLQPMIAVDSINAEIRSKTMEMLYLSRLSASRIVLGKYYSQLVQIVLLAVTIFPYIVMRYFAGGINPVQEIVAFIMILLTSSLMISFSVASSSFAVKNEKSHRARVTGLMILYIFGFTSILGGMSAYFFGGGGSSSLGFADFLMVFFTVPFVIYQVLSLGISQVSPDAENNLVGKRLNCFLILAVYLILRLFSDNPVGLFPVAFCFLISAFEGVFSKDVNHVSSYRPAFKYPRVALLFAPNSYASYQWFNFAIIMVVACGVFEGIVGSTGSNEILLVLGPLALCGAYYVQLQVAKVSSFTGINAFLSVFLIPVVLFFLVLLNDNFSDSLGRNSFEFFAAAFGIYLNIFIPYGLAIFIAKWRKEPLAIPHYMACVAVLAICALLTMVIKGVMRVDLDDSLLLFPMEFFAGIVDNNAEEGELYLGFVLYFQLIISGIVILNMLKESSIKLKEMLARAKAQEAQSSDSKSEEAAILITNEPEES
jgi:ABC-type transport system involved in multi-copper enzyme maturation permease subunit